ncbi:MAG: hypothetical protein WC635_17050 [Bacteriovorax sp.]|jgi:hypothetical protein
MRYIFSTLFLALVLTSCSTSVVINRSPAADEACTDIVKKFFSDKKYEKNLVSNLAQKKLITFTEKKALIRYPKLEWLLKLRKSFNTSLRNWNNNRYPSFYIFNKENIISIAEKYAQKVVLDNDEIAKASADVSQWTNAFKNYQTELDQLIDERISLQYNINLLKKLKLESDEPRDVLVTITRGGKFIDEIITFRKEDKNLDVAINKFKLEMKELDGTLLKNGKIKDRIIRQAMLQDMLTIVQRQLEYSVKNAPVLNDEMALELQKLTLMLKKTESLPSTYGVYKIENKIFLRELLAASKLDKAYAKIKGPLNKLKSLIPDFFDNSTGTDAEKIGILSSIYAKITNITPKQAGIGGAVVVVGGIGAQRYFSFKDKTVSDVDVSLPTNESSSDTIREIVPERVSENIPEISPEDIAHNDQLERTEKIENQKSDGHSSVVEIQIDELTK